MARGERVESLSKSNSYPARHRSRRRSATWTASRSSVTAVNDNLGLEDS
jgi:hypothetical protein